MILSASIRNFTYSAALLTMLSTPLPAAEESTPNRSRQEAYLAESLKINMARPGRYPMTTLHDKTWEDWQKRTGELPPDFALMKSEPFLPDPLILRSDGEDIPITSREQWDRQKQWVLEQYQHWVSGTVPPAPGNVEANILEDRHEGDLRIQLIELRFGPDHQAKMTVELMIPPGTGPRPVYLTQWNHREWAQLAVRRGYIGAVYAGADVQDDTDAYQALYPDYDWSQLMRRAWGASRVVDYLFTRPEVNLQQIAITGHSRNGKQSLWATAFDDRIGAVISSSCGTGGIMPWRYSDPQYTNETLDAIAGVANVWFHPRLRFFFGREDKLPVDQNLLLATIAPRPLLMTFSHMEHQSNLWAAEKCFHSVRTAYSFLDSPDSISMFVRQGEHAVAARDVERHIDFLDVQFGRRNIPWKTELTFDFNFEKWAAERGDMVSSASAKASAILRPNYASVAEFLEDKKLFLHELNWLLGDEPPGAKPRTVGETTPTRIDWIDKITGRPLPKNTRALHIGPYNSMGDHLPATVYIPLNDDKTTKSALGTGKLPLVIYLHQYSYAHGYAYGYNPRGGGGGSRMVIERLTNSGFAVMAIDMFGFGTRMNEAVHFYERHPEWSKLGKMVADVSACVDAAQDFDFVDADHIFVLGDTIGGVTGLMAAAKDERISAVAAVAAVSPWRASNDRYESIRVLSHEHGLLPRLGLFADDAARVPVDFDEILATIAPRPMIITAPTLDRHPDPEATSATLSRVQQIYKLHDAGEKFQIETPLEINRLMPDMQQKIIEFFREQLPENKRSQRR